MASYVALLDILGFKNIVEKKGHSELYEYFRTFRIHLQGGIANWKSSQNGGELTFDVTNTEISSLIISDTIIFWSNEDSSQSFFALVKIVQEFLRFNHNLPKRYLRGGITHGDFTFENNGIIRTKSGAVLKHDLMFGKALSNADWYEKNLEMIGCIIDENALKNAEEKDSILFKEEWTKLIAEQKVVSYPVEFKSGIQKMWTLNWVQNIPNPSIEEIVLGFSNDEKSIESPSVKKKIKNTVLYFLYVKKNLYGIDVSLNQKDTKLNFKSFFKSFYNTIRKLIGNCFK